MTSPEFTPGAPADPFSRPSEVAANDTGEKTSEPTPPAKSKDVDWSKWLNQPVLMTETPVSPGGARSQSPVSQGGEGKTPDVKAPDPKVSETKIADQPEPRPEIVHTAGGGVTIYPPPGSFEPDHVGDHPATRPFSEDAVAGRDEANQHIRTEASVDYARSPHGIVVPASVVYKETAGGELISENVFRYSAFRRFSADSEVKFTEISPPD